MPRVAVVGCGPAGLAFAAAMADIRMDITLLERSSTTYPSGSGFVLQPSGLEVADALNIRAELEANGQRIKRVLGHTVPRNRLVIDVDYAALGSGLYALGLHRSVLVNVLRRRVEQSEIFITTSTEVQQFERSDDGVVWLRDANGDQLGPYDLVVDASGARSRLRTQVFGQAASPTLEYGSLWGTFDLPDGLLPSDTLQQRFGFANASIGLMPLGPAKAGGPKQVAFFWNIKCSAHSEWLAAGLPAWKAEVCRIWPECEGLLEQVRDANQLVLARWRHHAAPQPLRPGIVFIGDAAHSTSPQLGQGINMSMLDAIALARAIRTEKTLVAACRRYADQRRRHVGVIQNLAKALVPFYQSPNRLAIVCRDLLFQPLCRLPFARRLIARLVAGLVADPLGHAHAGNSLCARNSSKLTCP